MVGGIRLRLLFGCVKGVVMEEMMVLMEENADVAALGSESRGQWVKGCLYYHRRDVTCGSDKYYCIRKWQCFNGISTLSHQTPRLPQAVQNEPLNREFTCLTGCQDAGVGAWAMRGSSGWQCGAAPSPSFLDEPHPASTPRGAPLGIVSGSLSVFDRCLGLLACQCPRRIYV